ncbi:hypothetical protein D9758_014262 [Tetrapyrgos nigripes]|uniref:Uncharacterized protein n=1 Tax=Tetrapyrgos nigripes TaxID=182062 RepID=A0A8H5CC42_9AGAR|nr:hypothetical protein D9758_014262 [Tetrapyrgos nigripes]
MLKTISVSIPRFFTTPRYRNGLDSRVIKREYSLASQEPKEPKKPLFIYTVSTVVPSELTSDDYCKIAERSSISFSPMKKIQFKVYYDFFSGRKFPTGSGGFFYYHTPDNAPLFAGGIRFRVTPSEDPQTFQDGFDLLNVAGLPWEMPNWQLVLDNNLHEWGKKLDKAAVIRPGALQLCKKLLHSKKVVTYPPAQPFIWSFRQPFPMMVGKIPTRIWVVNEEKLSSITLYPEIVSWFGGRKPKHKRYAHVCFDKEGDDLVLKLVTRPQKLADKMTYPEGYTTSGFTYRPRTRMFYAEEALEIIKNFAYRQPQGS